MISASGVPITRTDASVAIRRLILSAQSYGSDPVDGATLLFSAGMALLADWLQPAAAIHVADAVARKTADGMRETLVARGFRP